MRDVNLHDAVCAAFRAAHLLTGNLQQAEEAVLEAIALFDPEKLDVGHDSERVLMDYALWAALRRVVAPETLASSGLPVELQAVLDLESPLRFCFVLRTLLGISRQSCSLLLGIDVNRVDRNTCLAVWQLARLEATEEPCSTCS